ncbi:MAG: AMP-binding protein, partial [Bacteroidetes bacterium]|nr:AMP-binding protein [Bacteroidota bacterium]
LWQLAADAGIHHFGTSAPFIMACQKAGIRPADYPLPALRSIGSTGSPLPPEGFSYVYESIKPGVWLCSMSGGSDVCTAFVGGNPWWPVYEGEIQCRTLGCAMESWDENGKPLRGQVGEMVVTKPMPSMPIFFWNDPHFERYNESYFSSFPGVWRHGDWLEITERNGLIIHGRSDATLNRQGVRIGTAEIYRAVEKIAAVKDALIVNLERPDGSDFMPLFIVLNEGYQLDEPLQKEISQLLRNTYSPRHVPHTIVAVPDIPYTISGKKLETPVKKILMGKADISTLNTGSIRNPESLQSFASFSWQ